MSPLVRAILLEFLGNTNFPGTYSVLRKGCSEEEFVRALIGDRQMRMAVHIVTNGSTNSELARVCLEYPGWSQAELQQLEKAAGVVSERAVGSSLKA